MSQVGIKRIRIGAKQLFKLRDWVQAKWDVIEHQKLDLRLATRLAEQELGFSISTSSMETTIESLGRSFPKRETIGPKKKTDRVRRLARLVRVLTVVIDKICEATEEDWFKMADVSIDREELDRLCNISPTQVHQPPRPIVT